MDIVDRIQEIVNKMNISIAALERETGLSNGIIKKWKKQSPSCDKIITIANYLNVSIEYLLLGKFNTTHLTDDELQLLSNYGKLDKIENGKILGRVETLAELAAERAAQEAEKEKKMQPIVTAQTEPVEADPQEPEEYKIIYYDYPASAGTGLFLDETVAEEMYIKPTPESMCADFAIPISGDSMEPDFSSGDVVLVESCPTVTQGKVGIFVLDGDVYIKEYGGDCLISYNEEYPPIMLKEFETAVCLGRVLGKAEIIK